MMNKRILSIVMAIAMVCVLVPTMSFSASAEEIWEGSEVISFENHTFAESDHFTLIGRSLNSLSGWLVGLVGEHDQSKIG